MHAKAAGAWGELECTHDITHITSANFLSEVGKKTKVRNITGYGVRTFKFGKPEDGTFMSRYTSSLMRVTKHCPQTRLCGWRARSRTTTSRTCLMPSRTAITQGNDGIFISNLANNIKKALPKVQKEAVSKLESEIQARWGRTGLTRD